MDFRLLRSRRVTRVLLGLLLVSACWFASLSPTPVAAQSVAQQTGFIPQTYRDADGEHQYVIFVPRNYTPAKKWPVILFLHGAGERGTDGSRQLLVGLGPYVNARKETFPFLVVFPQCEDIRGRVLQGWLADSPDGLRAVSILDQVQKQYSVDSDRQILTGWSMGGYGAWSLAAAYPARWSAVLPLAGGGKADWADKLSGLPIWAFHGVKDSAVPVSETQKIIEAIHKAGGHPLYSEVANVGHDVWQTAYGSDAVYDWMLRPDQAPSISPDQIEARSASVPEPPEDVTPFVPEVEIPQAVAVRVGNDLLKSVSEALPALVPQEVLRGRLQDMYDSTYAEGRTFSVVFSGISYSGQLTQAELQAAPDNKLKLRLGLENLSINIGSTYVNGERHSAVAGPIAVVIGSRGPVWWEIIAQPSIKDRKIALTLVSSSFPIPYDNYYVTSPAGVSTQGFGMTQAKVSSGLVSGLYGARGRVSNEVAALAPKALREIETRISFGDVDQVVGDFWPLPIYGPRLRAWPDGIQADQNGLSVVMGLTAAAIDPRHAPATPKRLPPLGPSVLQLSGDRGTLRVGLTPKVLTPLSQMLVDQDLARIHVLDIPDKSFHSLADPEVLKSAIPDLNQNDADQEIRSELILTKAIMIGEVPAGRQLGQTPADPRGKTPLRGDAAAKTVAQSESTGDAGGTDRSESSPMGLSVPQAVIEVSVRPSGSQEAWQPRVRFVFSIEQQAQIALRKVSHSDRQIEVDWAGAPRVTASAHFVDGYTPADKTIHVDQVQQLFSQAWTNWTQSTSLADSRVPDFPLGDVRLRIADVAWTNPLLIADFGLATIKITNSTNQPMEYESRGPRTAWGGPYTLPPGKSHEYALTYPLIYRRTADGKTATYTLAIGSHSEFRVKAPGEPPALYQGRPTAEIEADNETTGSQPDETPPS